MAKLVARMEKMKIGNLQGIQRHNQRETSNHSNKEIDVSKSSLNYDLIHTQAIPYHDRVKDIIDSQRTSTRAVRKDAVLLDEWIITSQKEFFAELSDSRAFFQAAVDYFSKRVGVKNIAYATVHLDETTPHMHLGIVPMRDGALSSKKVFDRKALKEIQEDLPAFLSSKGFDIERGLKGSTQKHLSVEEFKENAKEVVRMQDTIQLLQQEVTELDTQKIRKTNELYALWHDEWFETKQVAPDFTMTYSLIVQETEVNVTVDANTPVHYRLKFSEVLELFKSKASQLKTYIASKIEQLAHREELVDDKEKLLVEKEKGLDVKLKALNSEITFKESKNEQLTEIVAQKTAYIAQLDKQSELSVALPSYVRPSKLNKDIILVPKEKWEAKYIAANTVNAMLSLKEEFQLTDNQLKAQTTVFQDNTRLLKENAQLEGQLHQLKSSHIGLWNGLAKLLNTHVITKQQAKQLNLPEEFKQVFHLVDPSSIQKSPPRVLRDRGRER